jgi:chorismate mutase
LRKKMDDEKALLFIREEIDSIDSELISLLESRLNLSLQIGKLKKKMDKDLYDEEREAEILKKIDELALIYPKEDLKSIFMEIMKTSLNQQK